MEIQVFVDRFVRKPAGSKKTEIQFGVLAFDLGIIGNDGHPPPYQLSQFSDQLRANSPSGPWCVEIHNWSPALEVRETRRGYTVETSGRRERLHAEEWLMGGLIGYLRRYTNEYGALPVSVALYTVMSPCLQCVHYLERFPRATYPRRNQGGGTIPHWNLSYSQVYLRPVENPDPQPPRFSRFTKDGYGDSAEATARVNGLRSFGWNVRSHP